MAPIASHAPNRDLLRAPVTAPRHSPANTNPYSSV